MQARQLLEAYHLLQQSEEVSARELLLDLDRAIDLAPLTELEREVITMLYIEEPCAPILEGSWRGRRAGTARSHLDRLEELLPPSKQYRGRAQARLENIFSELRKAGIIKIERELSYADSTA